MDKKKKFIIIIIILFIFLGLMIFTFANPGDEDETGNGDSKDKTEQKVDKDNKNDKDNKDDKDSDTNLDDETENQDTTSVSNVSKNNQSSGTSSQATDDSYERAKKAVELAEEKIDENSINEAQDLVDKVQDQSKKDELQDRLDTVKDELDVKGLVESLKNKTQNAQNKDELDGARDFRTNEEIVKRVTDLTNENLKDELNSTLEELAKLLDDTKAPKLNVEDGELYNEFVEVEAEDEEGNGAQVVIKDSEGNVVDSITEDGKYTITATDEAYNEITVTITVDTTAPELVVDTINEKGYSNTKDPQVHATDANPFKTTVKLNGEVVREDEALEQEDGTYSTWFGIGYLADGEYEVTSTDAAGNVTETIKFILDRIAPTYNLVEMKNVGQNGRKTPVNQEYAIVGDEVWACVRTDEKLISDPIVTINGVTAEFAQRVDNEAGSYYCGKVIMTEEMPEGPITFTIDGIEDLAGNKVKTLTESDILGSPITLDKTAPTYTMVEIKNLDQKTEGYAKVGDRIWVYVTVNEHLSQEPTFMINGVKAKIIQTEDGKKFDADWYKYVGEVVMTEEMEEGEIQFTVSDYYDLAGNKGEVITNKNITEPLKSIIFDKTAPVITLNGKSSITLEAGIDEYVEEYATVTDNLDEKITNLAPSYINYSVNGKFVGKVDKVDTKAPGTYKVVYEYTDKAGNVGVNARGNLKMAIRVVTVQDTTSPVIVLNGESEITLEAGIDEYVEENATVTDNVDEKITDLAPSYINYSVNGKFVGKVDKVDTKVPGTYKVVYEYTDKAGNVGVNARGNLKMAIRVVTVQDTTSPIVTLNGPSSITLEAGVDEYTEYYATVTDNVDEKITDLAPSYINYSVNGEFLGKVGKVDINKPGVYKVVYEYTDKAGNVGKNEKGSLNGVIRTVVVQDTTSPVIVLNGESKIILEAGVDEYVEYYATVTDNVDEKITNLAPSYINYSVNGKFVGKVDKVDTKVPGTYKVVYEYTDKAGNVGKNEKGSLNGVIRTVIVQDTKAPEIDTVRIVRSDKSGVIYAKDGENIIVSVTTNEEMNEESLYVLVGESDEKYYLTRDISTKPTTYRYRNGAITLTDEMNLKEDEKIEIKIYGTDLASNSLEETVSTGNDTDYVIYNNEGPKAKEVKVEVIKSDLKHPYVKANDEVEVRVEFLNSQYPEEAPIITVGGKEPSSTTTAGVGYPTGTQATAKITKFVIPEDLTEGELVPIRIEAVDSFGNKTVITEEDLDEQYQLIYDNSNPTAEITFDPDGWTNEKVTATLKASEKIETPLDWTKVDDTTFKKEYSDYAKEDVVLTDMVGNTSSVTVEAKIDKDPIDVYNIEFKIVDENEDKFPYVGAGSKIQLIYSFKNDGGKVPEFKINNASVGNASRSSKCEIIDGEQVCSEDTVYQEIIVPEGLTNGEYLPFTLTLVDKAGNKTVITEKDVPEEKRLIVDSMGPTKKESSVEIKGVSNQDYVKANDEVTISFEYNIGDKPKEKPVIEFNNEKIENVTVIGSSYGSFGQTNTYKFTITIPEGLKNGEFIPLTITAYDVFGNKSVFSAEDISPKLVYKTE